MKVAPLFRALDPGAPDERRVDAIVEAALRHEESGLLFGAPSRVDLNRDTSLPLLALVACSTADPIDLHSNGVVVVTRRENNATLAETWSEWRDSGPPSEEAPTDEPVLHSFTVSTYGLDLRERMPSIPWRPGKLLVRVIVGDRVTEPCAVSLDGGSLDADPDVRAYLDWAAMQQPAPPLPPRSPIAVDYRPNAQTPEVPSRPGITLDLQKVSISARGHSLALRGAFNLPVLAHERIPLMSPDRFDAEGRTVVARVTVTLVVVGHDTPGPAVIPLRLDARSFVIEENREPTHAVGVFSLDLLLHPDMARIQQRYSVYAFAYEHMVGPLPLALVSEELIPTR